jgi:myo-inositol-1(or 4)-monophosphatase
MIQIAIQAAREAGHYLLENRGKVRHISTKSSAIDLVTEIDKESERRIIEIIRSHYPEHSILAEEGGAYDTSSDYTWIIDPLDGTLNFTHDLPIFCVSIGVMHKDILIAGVVFDPNADELYTAERGSGAYVNGERIRVSETTELIRSLLITGFPYDIHTNPDHTIERFIDFLNEAQAIRRLGSAAIDLCYIAAGRGDAFWESNIKPWDIAAGILLIEEAGGTVTNFEGHPATPYSKKIVASNGALHDKMLEILRKRI